MIRELIALLIIGLALALLHPIVGEWLEAIDLKTDLSSLEPDDES